MSTLTPKYFPAPITRAVFRLHDSDSFKDLPDGFIRIVISIIKKIDLSSPRKSIFANRTTIAEESGKSVETVQEPSSGLRTRVSLNASKLPTLASVAVVRPLRLPTFSLRRWSCIRKACVLRLGSIKRTMLAHPARPEHRAAQREHLQQAPPHKAVSSDMKA